MKVEIWDASISPSGGWYDITPLIAWQGLTFSRNDVDCPDAGRDMSGLMHRGRVGVKEKMNIQTIPLTKTQCNKLYTLLYPETIYVKVNPHPETNSEKQMYMYSNNVSTKFVISKATGEELKTMSFPLIEN